MSISLNSIVYPFKNHSELENSQKASKAFNLTENLFDFSKCSPETTEKIKNCVKDEILMTSVGVCEACRARQ